MAITKLERVARQMELYGLTRLQQQVVIDLFFQYIDTTLSEAISTTTDQMVIELFSKDVAKMNPKGMN